MEVFYYYHLQIPSGPSLFNNNNQILFPSILQEFFVIGVIEISEINKHKNTQLSVYSYDSLCDWQLRKEVSRCLFVKYTSDDSISGNVFLELGTFHLKQKLIVAIFLS